VSLRGDARLIIVVAATIMAGGARNRSIAAIISEGAGCVLTDCAAGTDPPAEESGPAQPQESSRCVELTWDGAPVLVVRRAVPTPSRIGLLGEDLLRIRLGLRISVDAAAFVTGGDLAEIPNAIELRRGFFRVDGQLNLWKEIPFRVEIGFVNEGFSLEKAYATIPDLPYLGDLTFGQFDTPVSLEVSMSSFSRTFMEMGLPVTAFAPNYKAGIQLANQTRDLDATWAYGWFADGTSDDVGEDSQSFTRLMGRATWLPLHGSDSADSDGWLVHLGISGDYIFSNSATIRFQSRPESFLAPVLLNTGDLNAKDAFVLGTEIAAVRGPLSIQSEFLGSHVLERTAGNLSFFGAYAYVSWVCTGETRPYDRTKGSFTRINPQRELSWRNGGLGAWELALRISYLDLNDGPVQGGTDTAVTSGVNWYWNRWFRIQANYAFDDLGGRPDRGPLNIFQMRGDLSW
jgi:phosphate-selective porin OprO/OprP